ncbi:MULTISPECIES: 5-oxoprolinase subunit PxpB [Niastella]|uniref:5-oxoprolinase subunit PxpB n=1 Tax=Niastella soli TaxID=2821487 RepID=A0ABS3YXI0_9BACT|nr:5-oxoprolinase subunit PxpB [Niastella soli]MBO9202227.1 5-oxoprolinase subunit PxpB [Niastella soli]
MLKKLTSTISNSKVISQYKIFPLGDSAVTFDMGNSISEPLNQKALAMQHWLLAHPFEGLKDCLVAYSSLTVLYNPVLIKKYYNPASTAYAWVADKLQQAFEKTVQTKQAARELIQIPVCYEAGYGPDLAALARSTQLTEQEVVAIHTDTIYNVYMIGFLPGFSYMGEVDERIAAPRKQTPSPVLAGSVGIAGSQTGIYPLNSPGGWQIVGRTPLRLFDPFAPEPVKLQAGDRVQFYAITKEEFVSYSVI